MTICLSTLNGDIQDYTVSVCNEEDRFRLAATSKEFYQKINNGRVWKSLGLGDFACKDQFRTMTEIFDTAPSKARDTAMAQFIGAIPIIISIPLSTEFGRLEATKGEWRILLELIKRDAIFPEWFQRLVENNARIKGISDIYMVLHTKGLLSNQNNITETGHFQGLMTAAEQGHKKNLKVMLRDFDLTNNHIKEAFKASAEKEQTGALKILSKEDGINLEDYGNALESAAENGRLQTVSYLLNIRSFYYSYLFEALLKANEQRHVEVVDALLECIIDEFDIEESSLIVALTIALNENKLKFVKELLHKSNASKKVWGFTFNQAVELKCSEIVEYMTPYSKFPYYYLPEEDYSIL